MATGRPRRKSSSASGARPALTSSSRNAISSGSRRALGKRKPRRWGRWVLLGWLALMVLLGVEYARLPDVHDLAEKNPGPTALMRQRESEALDEGRRVRMRQHWVPLSAIAPHAVQAVVLSEDAAFYRHEGVDWSAVHAAVDDALTDGKPLRGASTLTQQLAKNLYLSTDRSPVRKAKEWILARRLEEALTKPRILALYLNVVEWGDGIWGLEAASRAHFGVSASQLSVAQAAILASMLPAPRRWLPARRPSVLHRRAERLVGRMEHAGRIHATQAAAARAELQRFFGSGGGTRGVNAPKAPSAASGTKALEDERGRAAPPEAIAGAQGRAATTPSGAARSEEEGQRSALEPGGPEDGETDLPGLEEDGDLSAGDLTR